MRLCHTNLPLIDGLLIDKPAAAILELPEKVLQFGTGVLLRALPDYFIDKANKRGIFNGRVVVIKSTDTQGAEYFNEQDGLYTVCERGIIDGYQVSNNSVNASISRVLSARYEWEKVLKCMENPDIQLIISNTTEVGIQLVPDSMKALPPISFPGKLLACLYHRYNTFKGDSMKGMVIIPTELIPDNGERLKEIVLAQAKKEGLEPDFIDWMISSNDFCSSLVDRIVPGKLPQEEMQRIQENYGYTDELPLLCEAYRFWAIETSADRVIEMLSFSKADKGVVLSSDIEVYRELKLRLLNGSHTLCCGLAHLAGFITVREAMGNPVFSQFIKLLMEYEIAPLLAGEKISIAEAKVYANTVLDRFCNPFLEHRWLSICLQYSSKMALRNVPLLLRYVERYQRLPELICLGFAGHILFMRSALAEDGKYYGERKGMPYPIQDDRASLYSKNWKEEEPATMITTILKDTSIWGHDLSLIPHLITHVNIKLQQLLRYDVMQTMKQAIETANS